MPAAGREYKEKMAIGKNRQAGPGHVRLELWLTRFSKTPQRIGLGPLPCGHASWCSEFVSSLMLSRNRRT